MTQITRNYTTDIIEHKNQTLAGNSTRARGHMFRCPRGCLAKRMVACRRKTCTDAVFAISGGSLFQSVVELGKNENLKNNTRLGVANGSGM